MSLIPGAVTRLEQIEERFESLACIADVHANTAALDAVFRSEEFALAEAVAFLGCLTTGPDPSGVLARCQNLRVPTYFLAGNGERMVLEINDGRRDLERDLQQWLIDAHGREGIETIRTWPSALSCTVSTLGPIRLCHGSPRSDIELLTPGTREDWILEALDRVAEPTVVHGHTHVQYDRVVGKARIVGAGSVGLPYCDGPFGARWALLGPDVRLIVTPYEFDEVEGRVAAAGYPDDGKYIRTLLHPPTPAEIIEHNTTARFTD
jgi:predicted phosphodiesterase